MARRKDRPGPLEARSAAILQAIIEEYVATAQPVGSVALVEKYALSISPATVRNVMAELETAARMKLNAVMVVNNNHSGGVIENARFEQAVDFSKVAQAMGCVGFRVEKPADLPGALTRARNAVVHERRQALLNVITPY